MISTNEKYHITEVICKNSKVTQKVLREYLKRYSLLPYVCENCKCDGHWQNGLISLELDHRDGDNTNNELSNLRYLCPNCHALTDTYRGRNKKKASSNTISENEFAEALQTTSNIRQALLKLGLAPQLEQIIQELKNCLKNIKSFKNKCVETIHQLPKSKDMVKT